MLILFEELPGWNGDTLSTIEPALLYSASAVLNDPKLKQWHPFYQAVQDLNPNQRNEKNWRQLIQRYLAVHKADCGTQMHFTGYYEPLLYGSLQQGGAYQTPLYALPNDTIEFKVSRAAIVQGALAEHGLELVWVNDSIAAFFLQIQGSGRVQLEDGTVLRLGYAGTNRHAYHPIGKTLITRKALSSENVTMQSISQWLKENADMAEDVMSENQSYVFFKILPNEGPIGTQGVPLTPGRSLAVDQEYIPLGSLMWVDIPHPLQKKNLQHLMVAQDTGGAIKGAFRGDYFWGFGENAEQCAGVMNVKGNCYHLLPF